MDPLVPRYGAGALADVVPSLLAGLDVAGTTNILGLPSASRVCLLLIDGLGWQLLRSHGAYAPFLSSLVGAETEPITAGFPATTVTSIAALGTGLSPGEHGLVGHSFATGDGELLNALGWCRYGETPLVDLRAQVVPEEFQPRRTAFERAAEAGVAVHVVSSHDYAGSGLTRAVLRGGQYRGVLALGDLIGAARGALRGRERSFCYAYHADLDLLGHYYGPGSDPWLHQLAQIDHVVAAIAADLPRGSMLVVTADHGMVAVSDQDRVDADDLPSLHDGVRMLGGEARARHIYTKIGATEDVLRVWREVLGERAWILRRNEAIEAGWFGPRVAGYVRSRIGDIVVAARGNLAVVRSVAEPRLSRLAGHHGSLTAEEQLIPLLVIRNTG